MVVLAFLPYLWIGYNLKLCAPLDHVEQILSVVKQSFCSEDSLVLHVYECPAYYYLDNQVNEN